jgi:hypothetical protein
VVHYTANRKDNEKAVAQGEKNSTGKEEEKKTTAEQRMQRKQNNPNFKKRTVAASARWCVLHERMGINLQ